LSDDIPRFEKVKIRKDIKKMKIKVYTVKEESFRYGDSEGESFKRFATKEHRDVYFMKQIDAMRKISDLTEYQPNCFEDSLHKWAYDFSTFDETIEIVESEEGQFLNQLIIESRKDKIEKITGNEKE
jgi:hypothetical protein